MTTAAGLKITTLDKYIFSQLATTVLFAVVLFSIIWLSPVTMFELIQAVVNKKISLLQGVMMYLYHIPQVLTQTIPVAGLIGSIFVFQRLSRQFELVAIFASGVSTVRLMNSTILVGVLFGAVHLVAQEVVSPVVTPQLDAYYKEYDLKDIQDRNFVFLEKNRDDQLEKFFMIGQIQTDPLEDFVVLYYQQHDPTSMGISRILRAKSGYWHERNNQWVLRDGIEYVLNKEGVYLETRHFDVQQVRTHQYASKLLKYTRTNPMSLNFIKLHRYIRLLAEGGQWQDVPFFEVRFYQKFLAPIAAIIFMILGALLGMEKVRSTRSYGLVFGALVIFSYSILVPLSTNLGSMGLLTPWIMACVPLLVSIGITAAVVKLR